VAAQFIEDSLTVQAIGVGAAFLLLLWWAILHWRQKNRWLLDLQGFLSKHQMIPFHFTRFEGGTPWGVANHQDRLLRSVAGEYQSLLAKAKASDQTLEKYVGTSVSEKASKRASESELGGELRRVYVLFSDVRGFTRMTEQLKPEETVEILNKIFTAMEETLTQNGGDINKYIGDALFAYFRRPYGNEGDAAKMVLRTAKRMMDKFEILNRGFKVAYSKPIKIGLGIGITAGEAIVGNVGSSNRMEFTLIGDTVNMASRLCGIAENGEVLVNEEMAVAAKGFFEMIQMEPVRIKGKAEPQPVYHVVGESIGLTN
jgi:adenylate cyclase